MIRNKSTLLLGGHHTCIIIDCAYDCMLSASRALLVLPDIGFIRWEGPLASLGSSRDLSRCMFKGYLNESASAELNISIATSAVRRTLKEHKVEALVGSSNLFADQTTLLCDMGRVSALEAANELVEEVVVLSSSKAIILSRASRGAWEVLLTQKFSEDAESCIKKVRHRPSCQGGRTWAKPLALESQIAAKRVRDQDANAGRQASEPVGLLTIRGPLGAYPEELKNALVLSISERMNISTSRGNPSLSLQPYEWMEVRNGHGDWNGQIRLQLSSWEEMSSLRSLLVSSVVELDGEQRSVEVFNPYLRENGSTCHHSGVQGNGQGGRAGRPSPQ